MEGGDELANGAESFHPALWRPDGGGLEPTGTLEDRPYAPNPGAPVRPASVKSGKLASGWLAEYSCGESLLTQNRKHYLQLWRRIDQDDVFGRAAQLSYYFVLALFPLLIFLSTVLGYFFAAERGF